MRKGEIPSIDHGFMLGGDISSFGRLNRGSLAGIVTFFEYRDTAFFDICRCLHLVSV